MTFQKGNQLAKGKGRPKLTGEQKMLKLSSRMQVSEVMCRYLTLSPAQVDLLLEQNDLPVLDIAVLRNLQKMHTDGSTERLDWMMDHVMGKQASKVEVTAKTSSINLDDLSEEELMQLRKIAEKNK